MFSIHSAVVDSVDNGVLTWDTSLLHVSVVASTAEGAVTQKNNSIEERKKRRKMCYDLRMAVVAAGDDARMKNDSDMVVNNKCALSDHKSVYLWV